MKTQIADFINESNIQGLLNEARAAAKWQADEVIDRAALGQGLSPEEVAALLEVDDPARLDRIYRTANELKNRIYGKRLVLFAPLYLSNYCVNNCTYCGYRYEHKFARRRLTMEEIAEEASVLESMGHKRLALECGEDPVHCPIEYVVEAMETIYATKCKNGSIRRLNVNIAATTVDDYRLLKKAGIGTYILFQETYHRPTYKRMHPSGPKSDYDWHTTAMDRAMEGGIDDVGVGALFGLYDYKFEVLGLLYHALHLEEAFGVGPHTISVPRLRPAPGVSLEDYPHLVSDADFKKLVAILRLAVPYTGIILSTRENAEFRDQLFEVGVSQISAGSCTGVGGYRQENGNGHPVAGEVHPETGDVPTTIASLVTAGEEAASCSSEGSEGVDLSPDELRLGASHGEVPESAQFSVGDHRTVDQVIASVCDSGYLPSYCTACYRSGRTGDRFMALAKSGKIGLVCQPNAIMTFKEYLEDYASPEVKAVGEETIRNHLNEIPDPKQRQRTEDRLKRIEAGERDLYF